MSHITSFGSTGGGGTLSTLTGNSGGPVSPDVGGNISVVGSGGITVTGNPGTNTLTITSTGFFTWNEIVVTSAMMAVANGYIANNAALVTLTLPATAAVGDSVRVAGKGAGLWKIAQNSGQKIHFGIADTTTGITGYLTATNIYDCIELICITANTDWVALSSVGNITYA